jgi:pteridine reductase
MNTTREKMPQAPAHDYPGGREQKFGKPRGRFNEMAFLVTGASRRIGRQIALSLAGEGADIVIHYRNSAEEAVSLCDELRERGVAAWALHADFAATDGAKSLVEKAKGVAGRLDAVINNASSFMESTLSAITVGEFTDAMQVNAWAPFELGREFKRLVGAGAIINVLDARIAGHDPRHAGYILSKHALWIMTRICALEYAPGIRVNAVAPGLILPPSGKGQDYLDVRAGTVPLKRHGDPCDVAEAVVFLLKSNFITGQVLYVDGGKHLKEHYDGQDNDS